MIFSIQTALNQYKLGPCCQTSSDSFLLGLDSGMLFSISSKVEYPDYFALSPNTFVTAKPFLIQLNPFEADIFLVAYQEGDLALFSRKSPVALLCWKLTAPIKAIEWSAHRPSVFSAIDGEFLHVWDILEDSSSPIYSTDFKDIGNISILRSYPHPSLSKYYNCSRSLILGSDHGSIQVHQLSESLSEPVIEELSVFSTYIKELVLNTPMIMSEKI